MERFEKIKFENNITPQEYNELRNKVKWQTIDIKRTEKALQGSKYIKKAILNNKPIAMGRAISDGMYVLIVDIVVILEYQNKGIGKMVIEELLKQIEEDTKDGDATSVTLIAVSGKEGFYEKCGFIKLPNGETGHAMRKRIEK